MFWKDVNMGDIKKDFEIMVAYSEFSKSDAYDNNLWKDENASVYKNYINK